MDDIEAAYQTAIAQHRAGQFDVAEQLYRQILSRDPSFARAWHLLGVLTHQRGDSAAGLEYVQRAISLESSRAVFYSNLAIITAALGQADKTVAAIRRMMELEPGKQDDWIKLGFALCEADRCEEAVGAFQRVLTEDPNNLSALDGLGHAFNELGLIDESIEVYHRASRLSDDPAYRILAATQLPLVYQSTDDVTRWRKRLTDEVNALVASGVVQDLTARPAKPVFQLAHQGQNDVDIQRKLAKLYRATDPPPSATASSPGATAGLPSSAPHHSSKIRVGFVSKFFSSHTIGKLTGGLITRLSREQFHVTVFSLGQHDDPIGREIATSSDRYVLLPPDIVSARQAILNNPVDVLVYTDIGMDPTAYSLAFSRLAPVQCVTWGHPETTGLETIDYFVSSAEMETPEADNHYSERLFRLPSLTFYYHRSQLLEQLLPREAFGLDPVAHIYACPQSIYKFHPDFDAALAGILRRDPQGQVVLIQWAYRQADDLLKGRFARVMPDVADRIVFIRRLQQPAFLNFLTLVDILLDPFPYGGGNSSLEAFSFGVPVVTLPTKFLRGRITQAFCHRLGIEHCIAHDLENYIDIAVRLATDPPFREQTRQQILANQAQLFEDDSAIRDWEKFLKNVVHRHVVTPPLLTGPD